MSSARETKAWNLAEGLLLRAGQEGVSPSLLEAVATEVGYRVPYDVVNSWTNDGRLTVVTGSHGDSNYHARRFALTRLTEG